MSDECIFCCWGKREVGNIWGNELFIARLDSYPVSPGHAIIIPRRHVVDVASLGQNEWTLLQQSIKEVIEVIKDTDLRPVYQTLVDKPISELSAWFCRKALSSLWINTPPDAYNHGINDGRAAGRTIDHLHWHIIPRYDGDMDNPSGGVRHVIPDMGNYKKPR